MDRRTLHTLYERYGAHVHGRCRYILKDEDAARDATQDVFLKVAEHGTDFRAESQWSTWLIRIATNHCLNVVRMRRNKTRVAVAEGRIEVPGPQSLFTADRTERRALVRQILETVDGECAEIAVLYFVDELTQEEIGQAVGRSLPTIRKRLREFAEAAAQLVDAAPRQVSA